MKKIKRQQDQIGFLENQLKESDIRGKKLTRDDDMEIVEVSGTFLLEGILDKLDLPKPRYDSWTHRRGQFVSDVTFYQSKEHLLHPPTLVKLSSSPLPSLQSTIDVVSHKAIHYMEDHQKKVLQDYNYIELKISEEANLDLTDQLAENDERIKGLAETTGRYIGTVLSACDQIRRLVVSESPTVGSTPSGEMAKKHSEIQRTVARLNKLSQDAAQFLRVSFGYPEEHDDDGLDANMPSL
ncbi:hypothetical protein ACQJBY_072967 [Aegilops geniculata]